MHLLLLLLAVLGVAHAEKVTLSSETPVVFVINGVPHTVGPGKSKTITVKNGGRQNVQIMNVLGKHVHGGAFTIEEGHFARLNWTSRRLNVKQIPVRAAVKRAGRDKAVPKPPSPARSARPTPRMARPEPAPVGPYLPPGTGANLLDIEGLPIEGGTGHIEFMPRTSSWSNVFVDGTLVFEFRKAGGTQTTSLTTGSHTVAFKDPFSNQVWFEGTIAVHADVTIQLQYGKQEPPRAINLPEAWQTRE